MSTKLNLNVRTGYVEYEMLNVLHMSIQNFKSLTILLVPTKVGTYNPNTFRISKATVLNLQTKKSLSIVTVLNLPMLSPKWIGGSLSATGKIRKKFFDWEKMALSSSEMILIASKNAAS